MTRSLFVCAAAGDSAAYIPPVTNSPSSSTSGAAIRLRRPAESRPEIRRASWRLSFCMSRTSASFGVSEGYLRMYTVKNRPIHTTSTKCQ